MNKPLFLRGLWVDDNLKFDAQGYLVGNSKIVTFTLAAIDVSSVKLSSTDLTIRGKRMGIEFQRDVPQRVPLHDISIKIQRPTDGDFTVPLYAVFIDDITRLWPFAPLYWQPYLREHFPGSNSTARPEPQQKLEKVGGGVTPPEVLRKTEPAFNNVARHFKYSGVCVVNLVIGTDGRPQELRVARPTGLGLDDSAVAAVSQYVFKPAMRDGSPVPVQVNVEVNFQIK